MINMTNKHDVRAMKANLHAVFDGPQGQQAMGFLEQIGGWTPNMYDSGETNEIIARDANRRLIGTIKTILTLSPEQIVAMVKNSEE